MPDSLCVRPHAASRRRWRLFALGVAVTSFNIVGQAYANDYPTEAVADYIIGCMASNGQTQEALRRCSCSIDAVASILPYDAYEQANTVLRMRQATGAGMAMFRETNVLRERVDQLRLAQIEADFRCF